MVKSTNANGKEIYMLTSISELEDCKESIKGLLHFLCNTQQYGMVTAEDIENAGTQLGELMARVHRLEQPIPKVIPLLLPRVTVMPSLKGPKK